MSLATMIWAGVPFPSWDFLSAPLLAPLSWTFVFPPPSIHWVPVTHFLLQRSPERERGSRTRWPPWAWSQLLEPGSEHLHRSKESVWAHLRQLRCQSAGSTGHPCRREMVPGVSIQFSLWEANLLQTGKLGAAFAAFLKFLPGSWQTTCLK